MFTKYLTGFVILSMLAASAFAEIKMPKLFGDNMLLQREKPVKVWGTAEANAEVEVAFAGQRKSARASADGSWSVVLDNMRASKTPREMKIFENGKLSKTLKNALVGEVWILGGQSNMAFSLWESSDFEAAKARAKYPDIRYFGKREMRLSREPLRDAPAGSEWRECSPENCRDFSAIGFYFAEKLAKDLDVPVGLVFAAVGGTSMICWLSAEDAAREPAFSDEYKRFAKELSTWDESAYKKAYAAYKKKLADAAEEDKLLKSQGKPPKKRVWNFGIPPNRYSPRYDYATPIFHYNVKVAPISGLSARGILWYQGEGDADGRREFFKSKFATIVRLWRGYFCDKTLPFLAVQLTSRGRSEHWLEPRMAQTEVADETENMWVANILDVGDENNVHPKDKTTVGRRLEGIALAGVYGDKTVRPFAPQMKSVDYSGATARVKFDVFGSKLCGDGAPRGFKVLRNGKWIDADAKIEGADTVSVVSPDGGKIGGVRYLWSGWCAPQVWLRNGDGVPAFPLSDKAK